MANNGKNAARRSNWAEIKLRYAYGETLVSLANEYNIPVNTVNTRASREGWSKERKLIAGQLQARREEVVKENFIDRQNQVLEKQFQTAQAVYLQYQKVLAQAGTENNAKLIVAAQKTLAWATNSLRQVTGLPDRVIETHTHAHTDDARIEKTINLLRERFAAPALPPTLETEATLVDDCNPS